MPVGLGRHMKHTASTPQAHRIARWIPGRTMVAQPGLERISASSLSFLFGMTQPEPTEPGESRFDAGIRILLIVAAFAPFLGSLFYGYIYDDTGIILRNPVINGWGSLVAVWKHPYWANGGPETGGLYRPLLMAIFAVIWNGFHHFAIAFHLFAVALHATATVLLWRVLRRATSTWAAAGAALWFAVQPVHVEAVANIANSSEVLVGVWTLLLVLLLLPSSDGAAARTTPEAPGWQRAAMAALLYAAALLTKESGAVAPALALIAVWGWKPSGSSRFEGPEPRSSNLDPRSSNLEPRSRGWLPLIGLWTFVALAVAAARRAVLGGFMGSASIAAPGLDGLSAWERVWAMLSLGGRVARLMIWPTVQNPHYGPSMLPQVTGPTAAAVVTVAVIVVAVAASLWLACRSPSHDSRPAVAIAWCLLAFLPASNLLTATGQILAERTLYVSSMGVAMLLAWGLDRVFGLVRWSRREPRLTLLPQVAALATAVVLSVACIRGFVHTRSYARVWRSHTELFTQMVRADSLSYRGYQLLAIQADKTGHRAEADRLYARAYTLYPHDRTLLADYGEYLLKRQQPVQALTIGQHLLAFDDMRTDGRAVTIYLDAVDRVWGVDSALIAARRLTDRSPSARSCLFVGLALEAKGDSAGARAAYAAGLRIAPHDSALTTRLTMLESTNGELRHSVAERGSSTSH